MAINPFQQVDYLADARSRYTEQFKNKVVFDKYVELFISEFINLQDEMRQLMQFRSIDTAIGAQLDIIGDIVGQPRELQGVTLYNFGFDNVAQNEAVGSQSYGTLSDPLVGGVWISLQDPLVGYRLLNDFEYRTLIKVKIIKNTSNGNINDVIYCAQLLLNEYSLGVIEDGGNLTINVNRPWDDPDFAIFVGFNERELCRKYLPVPVGVGLYFTTAPNGFDNGFNNGFR
jgi:hypothetical protein